MTRWVARMLLPTALLLGGAGCAEPMIEVAKNKVYPALVFVKPIRETFEAGERQRAEVFGSGVIISADGLVVTNHHVAEKAIEVNCVLGDREQVPATVVGLDPETDLALLKLNLPPGHPPLTVARFGDSDAVEPGQPVLALGSPFGFTRSISQG
ncbi:MAG TPA: trypsin-like peptidase domain-containing protein, partial [Phycisphaerae bacterium]|nr:trypsin-like peptidase domain-containing protein [Phycisphaerae bacterium]